MLKFFELPMGAFCINGYGEKIKLTITEVYGFPDQTSYGGGYGAKGKIEIQAASYYVLADHYFTTGELFEFKEALSTCYNTLSGRAELKNTERELELFVTFHHTGKVTLKGKFQEQPDIENKLSFEIKSDQTCILSAIKDLQKVEKHFGDNYEIINRKS